MVDVLGENSQSITKKNNTLYKEEDTSQKERIEGPNCMHTMS